MISTPRLSLSSFLDEDIDQLGAILGDPRVMVFSDDGALDCTAQFDWLRRARQTPLNPGLPLILAMRPQTGNRLIGYVSLTSDPQRIGTADAELGFRLAHASWGHGFATEAAIAMIAHARTMPGLQRVMAIVDPNNQQSVRVLKKVGMTYAAEVMFDGYDYPDHRYVLALH